VHELGITDGIIARAREAAQGAGGVKVTDLYLAVTPAADFTRDSIEMYFDMLTQDDEYFRLQCGAAFETHDARPVCPVCGGQQVRFDAHAPMLQLVGVDVAEEEDAAERDSGVPDAPSA
jgi:Zn finger protein HypA/HybF involved in hydrogenase expression